MKIDFDHWQGSQIADVIMRNLNEQSDLQIIQALNPEFSQDGNQYCFLYGELPNDCVIGFGETPLKAMVDFVYNFRSQKAIDNTKN